MAQEIEKKFLVSGDFLKESTKATRITQGYLSSVPEERKGENQWRQSYITVKGIGAS